MPTITEIQNLPIRTVVEKIVPQGSACPRCGSTLSFFSDYDRNDVYCKACDFWSYSPFEYVTEALKLDASAVYEYFADNLANELARIRDSIAGTDDSASIDDGGSFDFSKVNRVRDKEHDPYKFADLYTDFISRMTVINKRGHEQTYFRVHRQPETSVIDDLIRKYGHERIQQSGLLDEYDRPAFPGNVIAYYDMDGVTVADIVSAIPTGSQTLGKNQPPLNLPALTRCCSSGSKLYVCSSMDIFNDLTASGKEVLYMHAGSILRDSHIEAIKKLDICVTSSSLASRIIEMRPRSLTMLMHRLTTNVPIVRSVRGRGGSHHLRITKEREDKIVEQEYSIKPFADKCEVYEKPLKQA